MALPAIAVTLVGGIVSGLIQFFTTRAGTILAGLGLSIVFVKGFEHIVSYVLQDMQTIMSGLGGGGGGSGSGLNLSGVMLQFAAYAGLFDGLNIIISGYLAYASMMQVKFLLGRLK